MDLLQQPEASVSLLQIFIFFTVCLHPCICFHCAQRMIFLPLLNTTIHYLKWQVLLQDAVTCLRFWADQNLTGFLLFFFYFVSFHPQETSFCVSHLICASDLSDVFPHFWSAGNSQEAAVDQCHGAVHVNVLVMQRSQLGPLRFRICSSPSPMPKGRIFQNLPLHLL